MPIFGDPAGEERKLKFFRDESVAFSFSRSEEEQFHTLFEGAVVRGYKADFAPLVTAAGLNGEEGVELKPYFLSQNGVHASATQLEADLEDPQLMESIGAHPRERRYVLKSLCQDTFLAAALGVSVALDSRVASAFHMYRQRLLRPLIEDVAPVAFSQALKLDILDVRSLPWEKVLEIRRSHAGIEFRRMLQRVRQTAFQALPNLRSKADLRQLVTEELSKEILDELRSQTPTPGSVGVGLLANVIPAVGPAVHAGVSLFDVLKNQRSWVSLLGRRLRN